MVKDEWGQDRGEDGERKKRGPGGVPLQVIERAPQ
jgi:hypothetical protein